jgi:hypothetical protein
VWRWLLAFLIGGVLLTGLCFLWLLVVVRGSRADDVS